MDNSEVVYLITYDEIPRLYKIGTTTNLNKRLEILGCGCPFKIVLVHTIFIKDAVGLEHRLHKKFRNQRIKGEWFELTNNDIEYIKTINTIDQVVIESPKRLVIPSMPISESEPRFDILKLWGHGSELYLRDHPPESSDKITIMELLTAFEHGMESLSNDELFYLKGFLESGYK